MFSSQKRFACWAFFYALAILYVSTVPGPFGFHFVPHDPGEAWRSFLKTAYEAHGSDQRADWVANALMLVPFGIFLTGALWWPRGPAGRTFSAAFSLLCCLGFVLAVKYLQLFFPPRTVTLNYILAQSLGAIIGVTLFCTLQERFSAATRSIFQGGSRALKIGLAIYTFALLLFMLVPFDFALNADDLHQRIAALPHLLFQWPGAGRSKMIRLAIVLAGTAATVPVGILLALWRPLRSMASAVLTGLVLMCAMTLLSLFVLSSQTHLAALLYRTAGIGIGAALVGKLDVRDVRKLHAVLRHMVLPAIPVYILAVADINGLLSFHWQSLNAALATLDTRSLIPLWNDYIVSKAQAAASTVFHIIAYAPVGVIVWLRRGPGRRSQWLAAIIAFSFSFLVELGRWLRAEGSPDFNEAAVAACAAWLAVALMPWLWSMFESIAEGRSNPAAGHSGKTGPSRLKSSTTDAG